MPEKSDQNKKSLYQKQKEIKPLIENVILEYLDGEMKESALLLVSWLRINKMKPRWVLTNQWIVSFKGKNICRITLHQGLAPQKFKWIITAYLEHLEEYEETVIGESLQNYLWDNVYYCVQKPKESFPTEELRNYALTYPCNIWGCAPGKNIIVCEKELTNICCNSNRQYFWCHDPDEATINAIKRLLELEQKARL